MYFLDVAGEYVRSDLVETEPGIQVHYDFQFLDYTTCEPIEGAYYEIFNANSTGVYSGTSNGGNGQSQLGLTFLRGVQPTDADGVAQFDTLLEHVLRRRGVARKSLVAQGPGDEPDNAFTWLTAVLQNGVCIRRMADPSTRQPRERVNVRDEV